jgi:hypothetical protein
MTPLGIKIVLHVHCSAEPFTSDLYISSSAAQEMLELLQHSEMIVPGGDVGAGIGCGWKLTDRGEAYVEHLQMVQLPVAKTVWEQPGS